MPTRLSGSPACTPINRDARCTAPSDGHRCPGDGMKCVWYCPMEHTIDTPLGDIRTLSTTTRNVLLRHGFTTLRDVSKWSVGRVLGLTGIGLVRECEIHEHLRWCGGEYTSDPNE